MVKLNIEQNDDIVSAQYALQPNDRVDNLTLGMMVNNTIDGMLQILPIQVQNDRFFKYDITNLITLKEYLGVYVKKDNILNAFYCIAKTIKQSTEYMINWTSFVLDINQIYVDKETGKVWLICLPILSVVNDGDTCNFFKKVMFSSQFDLDENGDYVGKLITFLNPRTYTIENFIHEMENILGLEQTVFEESQIPEADDNEDADADDDIEEDNQEKNEESIKDVEDNQDDNEENINDAETSDEDQEEKSEEDNKEDVEDTQDNQDEIKEEKNDSASDEQDSKEQENESDAKEENSENSQNAEDIQQLEDESDKDTENTVQESETTTETLSEYRPDKQTNSDDNDEKLKNSNITISASPFDYMQETSDDTNKKDDTNLPYLLKISNGEKIYITKDKFMIGKERGAVDYCILGNSAVSRKHAYIIHNEKEYFVIDNKSKNHTYLNRVLINSDEEIYLPHGAHLRFADEDFEFRMHD